MKVLIIKSDLKWCRWLAGKRSGSMGHAETKNSHNRRLPSYLRHYYGVIVEKAWSILTGYPVNTWTIGEGDDGTDFPGGINVKGSYQPKKPNLLFPVDQYARKIAKTYVFGWITNNDFGVVVEILGQISRVECDRVKKFLKEGERNMVCDTWFISNRHLTEAII